MIGDTGVIMAMIEDWTIYSWYCPNCKAMVAGLKNENNQIKTKCEKCGTKMIRTLEGRRHDKIELFASGRQTNTCLEMRRF